MPTANLEAPKVLAVTNLVIEFATEEGALRAVDNISFEIEAGKILGIVGESGCGKSVTALSLMRLLPQPAAQVKEGRILFQGRDLLALTPEEMRKVRGSDIGMIFQEPMTSLNPVFSVGFQIAEAIETHQASLSRAEVKNKAVEMLRLVGIPEPERRFHEYPHQLSGGMRQRIMIAMALSCGPKLLIADEPTTALDVTIQAQILDLIRSLQSDIGMAVILISHDLGVIAEIADEVMVMYTGKVVERAKVGELFAHPLHPYTRGLLDSLPSRQTGGWRSRIKGIQGTVPSLFHLPVGCRFQTRCEKVQPGCLTRQPELLELRPGHWVSCFEAKAGDAG